MGLFDWMTVEEAKKADYDEAKYRLNKSRPVARYNQYGGESSVKLAWASTPDGGGVAFPMLFPKQGKEFSTNSIDWDEYGHGQAVPIESGGSKGNWADALKRAYAQNEVYEFKTEAEAEDFAAGSWKKGHYFSSPESKYRENPNYKATTKSLGRKIPEKLWKDLMILKKDFSLDAHIDLYNKLDKEYAEKGKNIDVQEGYRWGYSPLGQRDRYDPKSKSKTGDSQVGYIMNMKDINEGLPQFKRDKDSNIGGYYDDGGNDADTVVLSPEYIYNLLGAGGRETGKMDSYSLLGMLMHEDMHAPGLTVSKTKEGDYYSKSRPGSIGHKDSKFHVLKNESMEASGQKGFKNIINSILDKNESKLKQTPKGEQGVSYFPFMEETVKALQEWLEFENLDVGYNTQHIIRPDGELIDSRRSSYSRLKEKYAK